MPEASAPRTQAPRLTLLAVFATASAELALAAVVLLADHRASLRALFASPLPLAAQLAAGTAIGGALAVLQVLLLRASARWREFSRASVGATSLSLRDIALVSAYVGVAEELLFRAALQPLLGIGWTSAVFTALHANYSPPRHGRRLWPHALVALAMVFGLSVALGVVFVRCGLGAAIVAHAVYDFIVLVAYRRMFGW
jgi:membrane protease YdiL (CAAX protease family)